MRAQVASPWLPEVVEALRALAAEGASASAIADALWRQHRVEVSRCAVIGKMRREGIANANQSPQAAGQRQNGGRKRAAAAISPHQPGAQALRDPIRAASEPKPNSKPLLALAAGECRWPLGEVKDPPVRFCAAEALPGRPYCAEHEWRASARPGPAKAATPARAIVGACTGSSGARPE